MGAWIEKDGKRYRIRVRRAGGKATVGEPFDSRAAAERALAIVKDEIADRPLPKDELTVAQYGDKVLTQRETDGVIRDTKSDRGRWEKHIEKDPIARMLVRSVRRSHVLAFIERLERKGLARQTVANTLNVLRVVFRVAIDAEVLRVNPTTRPRLRRDKRTERAWQYLDPTEQKALVQRLAPEDAAVALFAMATGLRAGELCALRLEDIHEEEGFCVVRYGAPPTAKDKKAGYPRGRPTKTGHIREVPLMPHAVAALQAYAAIRSEFNPHGLAFPTKRGSYRSRTHVLRWDAWRSAIEGIGRPKLRWHDLRHTCASSLVSGWWGRRWSLEEVSAMLGHSSIVITQRYAHLAESALKLAARDTMATGAPELPRMGGKPALFPRIPDMTQRLPKPLVARSIRAGGAVDIIEESGHVEYTSGAPPGQRLPYEKPTLMRLVPMRPADARRMGVA